MVSKSVLKQYISLQEEIKEVREKITATEKQIGKIETRLKEIEQTGETVKDHVKGGMGGKQTFRIEGFPSKEYHEKKTTLLSKKLLLNQRKSTLEILEYEIEQQKNAVEEFIAGIQDSQMRRIVSLRFIYGLSWAKVADRIGGGNNENSVKQSFHRFMEK